MVDRRPVAIGRGHGHAVDPAGPTLARRVVDRPADLARRRIDAQPGRQTRRAVGQHRAVDVRKEPAHIQRRNRARVRIRLIRDRAHRIRRIVDRRDREVDGADEAFARRRVGHRVGEAVRTAVVRVRCIGVAAVGIDHDRACCLASILKVFIPENSE